jgi:hypothetical protein
VTTPPDSPHSPEPQTEDSAAPEQPPPRPRRKIVWRIAGIAIVAVIVAAGITAAISFLSDDPEVAGVGDCLSRSGDRDVKIVRCTDAKAELKVVGKVDGKTRAEFGGQTATLCKPFPSARSAFWRGPRGGKGYVLCLAPNK